MDYRTEWVGEIDEREEQEENLTNLSIPAMKRRAQSTPVHTKPNKVSLSLNHFFCYYLVCFLKPWIWKTA